MTIGSIDQSLSASENQDFETLKSTREFLQQNLQADREVLMGNGGKWGEGEDGKLLLSMGMSSDFEAALQAGSDIVRVGTGIFGARHMKGEGN